MKKLLALVLTLVMTMSLMTVSNAATFSDDANIDYKEAVEVMAAVGVLAGDGTGAFDADGVLTRAAAAKIVTYLMIGADAAEGLAGSAVFTDVPADHWAAGYIGYLVSEGVVAGVGDGKFDPNGQVTALQFAKMLLVALGYEASLEKLVGADWAIATSKLAYGKKLFKGNDTIKVNNVATRQEAALYAFNALKAETMYYLDKGTNVILGDAQIVTGASDAIGTGTLLRTELYGTDLVPSSPADGYGNPANKWVYKGKEVGTFAAKPVVTFTTAFNGNELLDAVENAGCTFDNAADGYGVDTLTFAGNFGVSVPASVGAASNDSWLSTNGKTDFAWSANGVKVAVFANDDNIVSKIVITESIFDTIDSKVEDKVATKTIDERKLTTTGGYILNAADEVPGFEDIFASVEEGDAIVIVPKTATAALKVYAPTAVTGDVSYYKAASSLTVAGTNYAMAANYVGGGVVGGDEGVTLYIDEFGYAIGAEGGSTSASSAVVLSKYQGLNANGAIVDMALVLYADGTTARVEVGTMTGYTTAFSALNEGDVYLYDTNDDDQTCFTTVSAASGTIDETFDGQTLAAAAQTVAESAKAITLGSGRNFFAADAKFIYVSQDADLNWGFTVSDKMQDLAASVELFAVIDADGNIATLYIVGVGAKNTVKDGSALIFVADFDGVVTTLDKDGKKVDVYQYDAFIDGVKVEGFVAKEDIRSSGVVTPAFYENEYDTENAWYVLAGNGYVDTAEDIKVGTTSFTNASLAAGKYITVGSADVELASSTKYASNIDEIEISSLAELKAEVVDDGVTATLSVVYDNETGVALYVYVTAIA